MQSLASGLALALFAVLQDAAGRPRIFADVFASGAETSWGARSTRSSSQPGCARDS